MRWPLSPASTSAASRPSIYTPARAAEFAEAVDAARTQRTDINAQILVQHGVSLRLANLVEYRERSATFNADREAEVRAEPERRKQSVANTW